MLIFDDLAHERSVWRTSKVLLDLAKNGRHCRVTWFIVAQATFDLPPDIRSACDVVYAAREPILQAIRKMHEAYFGMLDLRTFTKVFQSATANYGVLCLDQTSISNHMTDCVRWTRAPSSLPPFVVCRRVYFELERRREQDKREPSQLEVSVIAPRV